jgi:Lanthionine synthetase C-like protein
VESAVRAPQPQGVAAPAQRPLLHGADALRALDAAERIYAVAREQLAHGAGPPESVGRYAGAALVAESLARAGRGGDDSVRAALRDALVFAPDRLSLYDGAGALAVVLDAVDPEHAALTGVRAKLRDALAASLRDLPPADPATSRAYELVNGAAGRAVALAHAVETRAAGGEPEPDDPARAPACAALASFASFADGFATAVERCLASADPHVAAVNLGVAHGIPGMLAALNVALPGERDLARRYVELLLRCSHRVDGAHRWGAVWRPDVLPSARRAWCYQSVGVAAVLADRARIDRDDALHALATNAIAAVLDAPEPEDEPWDFALCHGRSGVASILRRFADDERLARHAERLAREVLATFDERAPLGYRTALSQDGRLEDRAGFLDGALGIAQFLTDAATAQQRRWLGLFGLRADPATTRASHGRTHAD